MITETDELATALNRAAILWPELAGQRALLLRKILEVGIESIDKDTAKLTDARLANIQKLAGSMNDVWPSNWQEELAEDWPI
jgi:hypothetical protein